MLVIYLYLHFFSFTGVVDTEEDVLVAEVALLLLEKKKYRINQ